MDTAEVIVSLLVVVIIIVSLLSNVLVLICFLYSPEIRKQVPALFTLNLTFCNLLLTVSNMPLTLVGLVNNGQIGGQGFCQSVGFLDTFLTTNSMLSMAALSIDRWIAVVFPLSYHSKMRHRDAALVLGYTVRQRCLEEQKRRRQRATKKISTFIGSFVLCFAPYVITRIVELFPVVPINSHWGVASKCLAYSKAACDPFVYSLLRHQYRKTCSDIINRILKRSSLNTSGRQLENGRNDVAQTAQGTWP
ncbi:hypothetical protein COCON_G00036160 [Conger conger]|uniref:G-protein coupled receptors family 1 profile domain-containing protein n=1 Tax=Conger conger TaxID=82655 RepID=A0A9Q1DZU1_CONCO|nr:hypothetical protein COCON_G00036160 [Conger conger]